GVGGRGGRGGKAVWGGQGRAPIAPARPGPGGPALSLAAGGRSGAERTKLVAWPQPAGPGAAHRAAIGSGAPEATTPKARESELSPCPPPTRHLAGSISKTR